MISTKSVVLLVFASAVLLLFKIFTTGPGYATNYKFVPISCSCRCCCCYICIKIFLLQPLYSVESHLHIFTCKIFVYLANRLNVYSCCGVKRAVFIYRAYAHLYRKKRINIILLSRDKYAQQFSVITPWSFTPYLHVT